MKKIVRGLVLGAVAVLLAIAPVLAYYYGNLSVVESDGNDYTSLPVIASINASQLSSYGFISSTGLDTRVLTGDGMPLPHLLADDKVLFVTDLAAHENKSLVFYMGATSLSSFPIIVGYNGSFVTPDDPDLELGYVMELLITGYFNAGAADIGKNILYKEDAFRVYISAAHTIKIQALDDGDAEQWEVHYSSFNTGVHSVYLVCNGLYALLYVDAFDVAKDTTALYENVNWQLASVTDGGLSPMTRRTVYAEGRYWAFWLDSANPTHFYYSSSTDGASWLAAGNQTVGSTSLIYSLAVAFDGTYAHVGIVDRHGAPGTYYTCADYFRGELVDDGTLNWDAQDNIVSTASDQGFYGFSINVDSGGYPWVTYGRRVPTYPGYYGAMTVLKSSTNDGTWTTAGDPQNLDYDTTSPYYDTQRYCYLAEYHDTTHLYALWSDDGHHSLTTTYALMGNYFNGSSWSGSADTIFDGYSTSETVSSFDAVCDDDGNMFVIWSTSADKVYMRVRYADTSWGTITLVATSAKQPSVSYSPTSHCVYVVFISGNYVYGVSIVNGAVSHSGVIFTPSTTTGATMCNSGYSEYSGILYCIAGQIQHAMIGFYWNWNENGNDWEWVGNNVMPYINEIEMAVDGVVHLHYLPADIIENDILPDISTASDNDAIITWGTNIDGVTTSMGPLTSSSYQPAPGVTAGNWTTPQDVMPSTGGESITGGLGTLDTNAFYPVISTLSYLSGLLPGKDPIPVALMWVLMASLILIIIIVLCVWKMPHQLITAILGLGLIVLFNRMGIYPWWVYLIYVPIAISILVYERKPAL